jgi:transposase
MELEPDYKQLYFQQLTELQQLRQTAASLSHQLAEIKRLIYGSKTEKFIPADDTQSIQLNLDMPVPGPVSLPAPKVQQITYNRQLKNTDTSSAHNGRMKLAEHLERKDIVIEPAGTEGMRRLGEEITEELEYEPGRLFVNRFIRPKYVSADNNSIVIAPMVDRPLPKAIAGPGLLAQIVIDKYADHLPLHRQQQRFTRENVNIPYSTITDWVSATCKLITPLYDALQKEVLASDYLHVDETPIKVLDRDKKAETHRGYYWVYHNSIKDMVLFDYQPGRGREGPVAMLKDFTGHLQTDGYAAYNIFEDKQGITMLHCMAHARRKFYEAQDNDAVRSAYAMQQIQLLYAIERKAREEQLSADQVLELRQLQAVPILESLGHWMKEQYVQVLPKSTIGKALAYSIQRWPELMVYTTDGKLNIDNNPVENSIRPVAIGRKNYLFAGSHEAAQRSAMLYSLMGTCKLHDINPFTWLRDVLERIANYPINKVAELLPQNWAAENK